MTPRIACIASPDSWYAQDLARAARGRARFSLLRFADLAATVHADGQAVFAANGESPESFEGVVVRSMPPASLEQVVFRMDALACWEQCGVTVINPAKTLELAIDKYLTLSRLRRAGLPVPQTRVSQTAEQAMQAFLDFGSDAVIKPLFGGEGRGVTRLQDPEIAQRSFRMLEQLGAVIYLQEYIDHPGYDIRLLRIGSQLLAMRRVNATDWRTNLSRGGKAEQISIDPAWWELSEQIVAAIGAPLLGIDLLPDVDGQLMVIEVNAVPGWKGMQRATGIDIGCAVVDLLLETIADNSTVELHG